MCLCGVCSPVVVLALSVSVLQYPTPNDNLEIATGVPTLHEVTQALQQMKTGMAPGSDNKIFCRVFLNRIEEAIYVKQRQEEGGFRSGKGCTDQTFALRISLNRVFNEAHHYVLVS